MSLSRSAVFLIIMQKLYWLDYWPSRRGFFTSDALLPLVLVVCPCPPPSLPCSLTGHVAMNNNVFFSLFLIGASSLPGEARDSGPSSYLILATPARNGFWVLPVTAGLLLFDKPWSLRVLRWSCTHLASSPLANWSILSPSSSAQTPDSCAEDWLRRWLNFLLMRTYGMA